MSTRVCCVFLLACLAVPGEPDPVWVNLDKAYKALNAREYDTAVLSFRAAASLDPTRADIRKNLAYTYLKIGETEAAREEFGHAVRLDPADEHLALEYAFLCYESRREKEAYEIFRRLSEKGNATARETFDRIDRELQNSIERWTRSVALAPDSYSAHEELARLSERRGDAVTAAEHYGAAWRLRPGERKFLLDLGRVWQQLEWPEKATAALLAASRGAEPRVGELARGLLPERYPWVYEFRVALDLDPANIPLRRELAFLLLEMSQKREAEAEFRIVAEKDPKDALAVAQLGFLLLARGDVAGAMPLLERALSGDEEVRDKVRAALKMPRELRTRPDVVKSDAAAEALHLAEKSFDAGYLKDAVRYLRIAHENDPLNFRILVKLGWAYNLLHDDRQALEWFKLASHSPDAGIAAEARKAARNLQPEFARTRTTVWAYPMYSSRWRDLFSWAQAKTEFRPSGLLLPYVSARFSGDARQTTGSGTSGLTPAWLSESAVTVAGGLTTRPWKGLRAWVEAGYALGYVRQGEEPRIRPDIRGGLSVVRSFGRNLGSTRSGLFVEATADLLYISRFDRDTILYGQTRGGYTIRRTGAAQLQITWSTNITTDVRRLSWANSVEYGPGIRLKLTALPQPVLLTADALSGKYLLPDGTRPPVYTDFRVGLWYAFSH